MQELIQALVAKAGVTEEQAKKSIATVKEFIQAKLPPMMHGVIDNFLGSATAHADDVVDATEKKEEDFISKAKNAASQAGDKIEDFAADAKDKATELAKQAGDKMGEWAGKAEDMAEDAIDKLKGMFNGDKKEEEKK